MQTYLELSKAAQDQILEATKQSQQIAIQAMQAWTQAIAPYARQIPAAPVVEGIPTAEALVENSFGFATKLLQAQYEFAIALTQAWAPVGAAAAKSKVNVPTSA